MLVAGGAFYLGSKKYRHSLLRFDSDEQQTHPRPDDRLLKRPIVRRTPTHRTAATTSRGSPRAAARVPLPLILASLVLRPARGERP